MRRRLYVAFWVVLFAALGAIVGTTATTPSIPLEVLMLAGAIIGAIVALAWQPISG